MTPRILTVKAAKNTPFTLEIQWDNNHHDFVDMSSVIHSKSFIALKNPELFRKVEVINWGHGIAWPEAKLDYNAEMLYLKTKENNF